MLIGSMNWCETSLPPHLYWYSNLMFSVQPPEPELSSAGVINPAGLSPTDATDLLTVIGTVIDVLAGRTPIVVDRAVNVYSGSVGRPNTTLSAAMSPWLVTVMLNVPDWP